MRHMPMMDAYRDVIGGTRDFAHGMMRRGQVLPMGSR
jgi:hypothetical protein